MRRNFYAVTRDLHLYLGLFVSPFVLVFCASVFALLHPSCHTESPDQPARTVQGLRLVPGIENLTGRARVDAVRQVLGQIGISGEIGFIQHEVREHRLIAPVVIPGRETTVDIDLVGRSARISDRDTSFMDSLILLHKSPGPHLADIRMNWLPMRIWRWLADTTVCLVLFLSISGIYMWAVLRSERRVGIVLLVAGTLSFVAIIYALVG